MNPCCPASCPPISGEGQVRALRDRIAERRTNFPNGPQVSPIVGLRAGLEAVVENVDLAGPRTRSSRREFLVKAIGGTIGLLLAVPILGGVLALLFRPTVERQWVEAGRVDDLRVLEPRPFRVRLPVGARGDPEIDREVFAVRGLDGSIVALLNECTHLGCPVRWLPERHLFYCPCHRGYFNVMGYDVNGPPPRPLYRLRNRVENGLLFVSNEKLSDEGG